MIARLIGILIVAAGLAVGKFAILDPLQQAEVHALGVHTYTKVFVFVPLAIVSGLALFLGGNFVLPIFLGKPRDFWRVTLAMIIMAIAFTATGISWWLFQAKLSALGYVH